MGIFDKLKGIKEPAEGTPVQPGAHLYRWLLGLGGDQVPFSVAPDPSGTGDLVIEWKIVDASWYQVFGQAGLEKSHRIYLVLDEAEHHVRALEESWEVSWSAGVPSLSLSAEKFQGRTFGSKEFGKAVGFRGPNPLDVGVVYEYRFDVSEMKDPVITLTTNSGWTFVPVLTKGKLRG
jgi:hypothetical protein